ncbi:MAG: LysR family transcriptional regulator [Acidaminococcus sp.]|jgi:DNA-binding transcriptional LysR family regulator|nr:LysR family transcriptional regulator [Acidaminococcus sp.]MCI2100785.1 LysR family transcriptional regulator [Acidaminococcus sp.]MCI2115106.1 LysR family transcriptional regulator [Acidaminococcus sp.]MCI2117182.1 LysR family transcriptional regulator [Acidaminococcus sp.]
MNLPQLHYFKCLAETLHYTRTAEKLHISQPGLSYAIHELEKELGVPLFERRDRHLALTKYGEVFYRHIDKALKEIQLATEDVRTLQSYAASTISLGYMYSLSTSLIPKVTQRLSEKAANRPLHFSFVQQLHNELIDSLKSDAIDFAFVGESDDPAIETVPIEKQDFYLVVAKGHQLAKYDSLSFQEFKDYPLVTLHQTSSLRRIIDKQYKALGAVPIVLAETKDPTTTLQYITQNYGITIIPDLPNMDQFPVKRIQITTPGFCRTIYLAWKKQNLFTEPVRRILDFMVKEFGKKTLDSNN